MKQFKRILKIVLLLLGSLILICFTTYIFRNIRITKNQTVIHSAHFKIHYKGVLKAEAESISLNLEENYNRIRAELKDPIRDTINVFIHPSQKEFNFATGLINSKANGTSRGPNEFHLMYETWYNSIFPMQMEKVAIHEFTHCIQLNILITDAKSKYGELNKSDFDKRFESEFSEKYPQWFWEALCDYEANIVNSSSVKYAIKKKPTIKSLNQSNQIYNLGYTLIEFMVEVYGKDKLPEFIKSYGDFNKVLNITEQDFEKKWYQFVEQKY